MNAWSCSMMSRREIHILPFVQLGKVSIHKIITDFRAIADGDKSGEIAWFIRRNSLWSVRYSWGPEIVPGLGCWPSMLLTQDWCPSTTWFFCTITRSSCTSFQHCGHSSGVPNTQSPSSMASWRSCIKSMALLARITGGGCPKPPEHCLGGHPPPQK